MNQLPIVVFFSILMLIPGAIFPPQQASATIDDNLYKFDTGFYEMIQEMQSIPNGGVQGQSTSMHSVIIITDNGNEDMVESVLEKLGAQNIFKSYHLDFLIADVPINNIVTLASYDFIYKLGDGQEELYSQNLSIAQAKPFVGASNIPSTIYPYTGSGITVAVIDSLVDFTHPDLQNKNAGKVLCTPRSCTSTNNPTVDHGTSLAAIIAANSVDTSKNGIAPDAKIHSIGLDTIPNDLYDGNSINESPASKGAFARSLDHVLDTDIKIVVSSLANNDDFGCGNYSALTIVMDRATDLGLSLSMAIGNNAIIKDDNRNDVVNPISIQNLSCGFNYINVGAVDEHGLISHFSSKGPAQFTTPSGDTGRIKPEIVALGENLNTAFASENRKTFGDYFANDSGTSLANPFVAGASVLLLEKQPDYTPLEIKSALLLGADWKANVPATANDYDNKRTGIYDTMNQYGFGILNIEKSLDYANNNGFPNILKDTSANNFADQRYQIIANQNDQVKVLLSWFVHPTGTVLSATLPFNSPFVSLPSQFHNYDLKIQYPDGTIKRSTSDIQNNEFIVFDATQTGNYIITVSSDGTLRSVAGEPFVLASTHGIDKFPFDSNPPPITPPANTLISDNFQSTLSKWTLSGSSNWVISSPNVNVPGENSRTNKVLSSNDCDRECIITLQSQLDTNNPLNISFDRYVSSRVDASEGLYVEYSTNGRNWLQLASYTEINNNDTSRWTDTSITLDIPENSASMRFVAMSTKTNEIVEIDNLNIESTPNTAPVINDISNVSLRHTSIQRITLDATDAENDRITFSINGPSFVTLRNGIITINPNPSDVGTHTITVTATANGKIDTESFTVRVLSSGGGGGNPPPTSPVFTSTQNDITRIIDSGSSSVVTFDLPTANKGTVTCNPSSGSSFSIASTTVTCTVSSGNRSTTTSFSVLVELSADVIDPILTIPSDRTFEATAALTVLTDSQIGTATATDNRDSSPRIIHNTPASFPTGNTVITYTATDNSGNTASDTQRITISDTTPPSITAPVDITLEATGMLTMLSLGVPSVTDLVDSAPTVTSDAPTSFPLGTTVITWMASDDFGNISNAIQRITVQDTTSPILVLPADITAEATGVLTVLDIGTSTATDNVDYTISNDAPESFPLGTTIVTWTVMDTSGNVTSDTQRVTITDTTIPVFGNFEDITSNSMIINFDLPTATDIFPVVVSCDYTSGDTFSVGNTIVTCTATDESSNLVVISATFTVNQNLQSGIITQVYNGTVFIQFEDGISIQNNIPKFRGTSSGISSIQVLIDDTQVGGNNVNSNGAFQKGWKNAPLDDATYSLTIQSGDNVLFSSTIIIDMDGDGNPSAECTAKTDYPQTARINHIIINDNMITINPNFSSLTFTDNIIFYLCHIDNGRTITQEINEPVEQFLIPVNDLQCNTDYFIQGLYESSYDNLKLYTDLREFTTGAPDDVSLCP